MNFDEELINHVCQKYNLDVSDFKSTIIEFLNNGGSQKEPQALSKDDDIEAIAAKAKEAVGQTSEPKTESESPNTVEKPTEKKTREELKQDRTFEPGQRVKINTNYGTKQDPHYLVGEFVEDVDAENVKVKLLSTGRPRTVNKKSIVLTESVLFNRILKESFGSLTHDKPTFWVMKDEEREEIFLSEIEEALDKGKLVKVVEAMFDSLCLEIEGNDDDDPVKDWNDHWDQYYDEDDE